MGDNDNDDYEFGTGDLTHRDPDRFKRSNTKESGDKPRRDSDGRETRESK